MSENLADRAANLGVPAPPQTVDEAPAPPEEVEGAPEAVNEISASGVRSLEINMEGVSTEFEPLPVGTYLASVYEVEHQAASKKSGNPQLRWTFEIQHEDYKGRRVWTYTSLVHDALWKLAKTLNALGVEIPDGSLQLDLDSLVGLPCMVSVTQDTYQGKTSNPVNEVLPVSDVGSPPPY